MQENDRRITLQSVVIAATVFLALMVWSALRSSEGESDLATTLRFAQIAIYGSLAFATMWFGLRAVQRAEPARRVPARAIVVSVAVMVVIAAAGLSAAVQLG